jgi:hypothetical protein
MMLDRPGRSGPWQMCRATKLPSTCGPLAGATGTPAQAVAGRLPQGPVPCPAPLAQRPPALGARKPMKRPLDASSAGFRDEAAPVPPRLIPLSTVATGHHRGQRPSRRACSARQGRGGRWPGALGPRQEGGAVAWRQGQWILPNDAQTDRVQASVALKAFCPRSRPSSGVSSRTGRACLNGAGRTNVGFPQVLEHADHEPNSRRSYFHKPLPRRRNRAGPAERGFAA